MKGTREAPAAVGGAYASFGRRRPALYDAMFTHAVDLPFVTPEAPAALREAFGELAQAAEPTVAEGRGHRSADGDVPDGAARPGDAEAQRASAGAGA